MNRIAPTRPRRRLSAVVSAAGCGIGIPALLIGAAGWPLPRRLPPWSAIGEALSGQWRPDDHFVISALAVIAWAVWAQIGAVTLNELRTIRSGQPGCNVPWSAWCRPIALRLAATLAVLTPLAPRAAGAAPLPSRTAAIHALATSTAPAPAGHAPDVEPTVASVQVAAVVHIVRPGETLWDIARAQLGDPRRWRELFDLNRDRRQPDGRRLDDADLLRPGWRIALPAPPPGTGASQTATTATRESAPLSGGCQTALTATAASPASTPTTSSPLPIAPPSGPHTPLAAPGSSRSESPIRPDDDASPPPHDSDGVPSLGVAAVARVGVPALTGGVLLGYLGGLRRDRERRRRRHHRFPAPTAAQQAAERAVRAVARQDAPTWVDLALRHLAASLAEAGAPPPPTVRAVLAGDAGVEVLVSPPWPVAPGRFLPQDDGQVWRLDPALGLDDLAALVAGAPKYLPGVVTVGETDRGAVLIDLADAASLLIEGNPERTNAIASTMAAELATAPWAETCDVCLIGVAEELEPLERVQILAADTGVAELIRMAGREGHSGLTDAAQSDIPTPLTIVIVGAGHLPTEELAHLVAAARPHSRLAVIAATPAASGVAGRFRLVCDDDRALLYPLGLTVTPAQSHATSRHLLELVTATATSTDIPLNADGSVPTGAESADEPTTDGAGDGTANDGTEEPAARDLAVPADPSDVPPNSDGTAAALERIEEADGDGIHDGEPGADVIGDDPDPATPCPVADVRLLGPLEITWQGKTPKRQVGELVSYLAAHPRGITSDEVRLALWPASAEDDRFGERARSTFWALTTKARSALGDDHEGNPLLIREANNGLRLSPAVRCDWLEFQRLIAAARHDPDHAATSLKAALSLVRGRPFQGSVFPWVAVDRLDGVMEAVIADAGADLAELALADGDLATARFAVTQGLLGVPHAETLVRLAMRIAAAAGDRPGIERAWRDAQRIATDLDPLGVPEPETAELYESLRRKDRS